MNHQLAFRLKNIILFWVLLSLPVFSSCQIHPHSKVLTADPDWKYADLKLMDPIDSDPSVLDLIAVYIRLIATDFQVRIDFLDLNQDFNSRIFLALDTGPGGIHQLPFGYPTDFAWDSLIEITPSGTISASDNNGNAISDLKLRTAQNPTQDFITISVSSSFIHKNTLAVRLQIFVMGDSPDIKDQSAVISEYDFPPRPVNVIFGFWNTFNPISPATGLRSWDGAHSGMYRDRQGLRYLVEASLAYQIPVSLLDLKTSKNLSALDYLGGMDSLRQAVKSSMITLPDVMSISIPSGEAASFGIQPSDWIYQEAIRLNHDLKDDFRLPANSILVTKSNAIPAQTAYDLIVTLPQDTGSGCILGSLYRNQFRKMLILDWLSDRFLCSRDKPEATSDGPSIELRHRIINAYSSGTPFLMIGGDFLNSNWGNPAAVRQTMHYMTSHPWIHLMSISDLLLEPSLSPSPSMPEVYHLNDSSTNNLSSGNPYLEIQRQLDVSLQNMTPGSIKNQFWAAYQNIFSQKSGDRYDLALNYLGQLGFFLPAYAWSQNPQDQLSCSQDLDWDGHPECILSDQHNFLIVDGDGGVISMAFARSADRIHQLIGPTTQLAIGVSDPMDWDMARGLFADPGQILGALQIQGIPGISLQATISKNVLILRNDRSNLTEIVSLDDGAINVKMLTPSEIIIQIPILFDPWSRFSAGWQDLYRYEILGKGTLYWGSPIGTGIDLKTTGQLSFERFNQTRQAVLSPEDPNFDYGAGHYLPFPLALAQIHIKDQDSIQIRLVEGP